MPETIFVLWGGDSDASSYIDVLPEQKIRDREQDGAVLIHAVLSPQGERHEAKCRLAVSPNRTSLDYGAFDAFNNERGMVLGEMRLVFAPHNRISVQWGDVGEQMTDVNAVAFRGREIQKICAVVSKLAEK